MTPLLTKGAETFLFVEKYFNYYNTLFSEGLFFLNNSHEFLNYITLMTYGLEADYWKAPLLRYYDKFKQERLLEFVHSLDKKISADWIVGISPTTRIDNVNAIIQNIDDSATPEETLASPVYDIKNRDLLRVLASNSLYGRRFAKYLLLKLDLAWHGHTTRFAPPDTISIEHILPQTPNSSSRWVKDFDEQSRDIWTDKLGNLILLSRRKNTSQSNLDYSEKKKKYFSGNIELFSNSVRIFNTFDSWNMTDLRNNHLASVKKILILYGVNTSYEELERLRD